MYDLDIVDKKMYFLVKGMENEVREIKEKIESLDDRNNEAGSGESGNDDDDRLYLNNEYEYISRELEIIKYESNKRAIISYCTAFESFLRSFLLELVPSKFNKLQNLLREEQKLPIFISEVSDDDLDAFVERRCSGFGNIKSNQRVDAIYRDLLGKKPFNREIKTSIFPCLKKWNDHYTDIQILFLLRHVYAHRNGKPGNKYQDDMKKIESCKSRLNEQLIYNFQNDVFPEPKEILESKPINNKFDSKVEEFADSLILYARHIESMFS